MKVKFIFLAFTIVFFASSCVTTKTLTTSLKVEQNNSTWTQEDSLSVFKVFQDVCSKHNIDTLIAYDTINFKEIVPVAGYSAPYAYLRYPEDAFEKGIEGRVIAVAVVDESARIIDLRIAKSLYKSCDEAVLEAVRKVKFYPAEYNGKPVLSSILIPISFKKSRK
jgi:TonB family protein